tara:strand:- start:245 stop:619 length:375 start_codon:yes stop_codon:yes gene_type:complete
MKQCSICGASAKRTYCKACQAAYHRKWYAANKEQILLKNKARSQEIVKWLADYKVNRKCAKCGYHEHPCALDFHHNDESTKSFALSAAQRKLYGMAKIKTEVAKCSVLCANCHRVHHHKNKGIA